ncbi:MAG: hypothetical protein JNK52_13595 [Zoogloeaceae bacterium]|nr:hypothetical protein [Zoogloeaceae bacterium]
MNQSINRSLLANPIRIWSDLALQTTEMMMASAHVIGHRTGRMAVAGPNPSEHDLAEFNLMGQEKIEAATESLQAMAEQMMRFNLKLGSRAMSQMMECMADMMMLATSRTPAEVIAGQAKLIRTLTLSAATAAQFSSSAARVASSGMKPVLARATANSTRLAGL